MFFILSKTLYFLAMPLTVIILFLIASVFLKKQKYKRLSLKTAVFILILFSNSFIANEIMNTWEIAPTKIESVKNYGVGIVLTGITNTLKSPNDRVYFNHHADRITHALQLYKLGKIKKILISGGSGALLSRDINESENLKKLLLIANVPETDIIIEKKSNNTHENAQFSAEILKTHYPNQKHLLITSAFHMRRARACFGKEGLNIDTFSAGFNTADRQFTPDVLFVPNVKALDNWTTLTKEWLGYLMYWIVGYI